MRQLSVSVEGETSSQTYTYVETDFIKALKNGYLVEIQEPSTILQPGVLVGLNSLLEQEGTITLPTGEVIRRHPDAVVVVTTNVSYEGCRALNQSVVDRMSLVKDIELPSPEVMAQRVMAATGAEDEYQVAQMVQVVCDMADFCRKNGVHDTVFPAEVRHIADDPHHLGHLVLILRPDSLTDPRCDDRRAGQRGVTSLIHYIRCRRSG